MRINWKYYIISISLFVLLLISSFFPVIQVILIYCNSSTIVLTEEIFGVDVQNLEIIQNAILTLVSLIGYYWFDSLPMKLFFASLTIFFANGFMVFVFWIIIGNEETSYYPWQFVSGAIFTGLGLILMDFIRSKKEILKSNLDVSIPTNK